MLPLKHLKMLLHLPSQGKKLKKCLLHLKHLKLSLLHLMLLKNLCECCSLMELLFFCFMKLLVLFYEIITRAIFFRTTPQRQVLSLDHQEMGLTTSPGSPLTRARKAFLLATNHQEMGLTTSPGSPLTRAKKALLLGKQN